MRLGEHLGVGGERVETRFLTAQAGLELQILLPLPPKCSDYRCVLPHKGPCLGAILRLLGGFPGWHHI